MDTPGIHKPRHKLGNILNSKAYMSMEEVDVLILVVDASEELGKGDKYLIDRLDDRKTILVLNKIDKIKKDSLLPKIEEYSKLYNFSDIVPIRAYKRNIDALIKVIKTYINGTEPIYYKESSEDFEISELVRKRY